MSRAAERIAQLVASIDRRLEAADDPLELRVINGRPYRRVWSIDSRWSRRASWWEPVEFVSVLLLKRGFGLKPDDEDDVPF